MTYRQEGAPDEKLVRYTRWDHVDESSVVMGEVYREELTLDGWIDADGHKQALGKMSLAEDEIVSETDFEDFPFKQDVHEATGNEGATVERWYQQAVVVVWPPDRYFRILASQGQGAGLPVLEKLIAGAKAPSADEGCRVLAREIIRNWKVPQYRTGQEPDIATMLAQLEQIADPTLVNQFVHDVLPRDYRGTEGEALCRIAGQLSWETVAEALTYFVAQQGPDNPSANLAASVSIVEALCCSAGKMTAQRRTACRSVADELERTIRQWDTHKDTTYWHRQRQGREGTIESMTRSLAAIGAGELLEQFLSHALADKEHYGLHAVLVPAVKTMSQWTTKDAVVLKCRHQLLQHCIEQLEKLTEKPVAEPTDWAQNITVSCKCSDCQELQKFLHDPQETTHRFRVAKARRQHLHGQIDGHRCDMTHITDRRGSPQTLVCTKNRASYERKKAQFSTDVQLLAELRGLLPPKRKK
jgi:hypothetical protein